MAATIDVVSRTKNFGYFMVYVDVTLDDSYTTGGYEIKPTALGLSVIEHVTPEQPPSGYLFAWDRSTNKLQAMYFDYDAVADGPAIEVPGGTDLSTVKVRLQVSGR